MIEEAGGGPDPGNAGDRRDGTEGVDLGAKFGLFPQAGARPEIALITTVTLPTAADLVRVDRPLPGAELVYGWEVTDEFRIAGSTQVNRTADDDGRDVYTEYAQSLTAASPPPTASASTRRPTSSPRQTPHSRKPSTTPTPA